MPVISVVRWLFSWRHRTRFSRLNIRATVEPIGPIASMEVVGSLFATMTPIESTVVFISLDPVGTMEAFGPVGTMTTV